MCLLLRQSKGGSKKIRVRRLFEEKMKTNCGRGVGASKRLKKMSNKIEGKKSNCRIVGRRWALVSVSVSVMFEDKNKRLVGEE